MKRTPITKACLLVLMMSAAAILSGCGESDSRDRSGNNSAEDAARDAAVAKIEKLGGIVSTDYSQGHPTFAASISMKRGKSEIESFDRCTSQEGVCPEMSHAR